ncbi:MAG TPA: winged helix-turn-helix domain-containing protein, partial [Caulobacteraceae bacterium]|nr:winged helix-turn-helix domain-containing protein [Caulobacteraceae bacterium]
MIYRFEDFRFDTQRCELRRGGELIELEPQVYGVLLHLIENRDRLVSREELIQDVWKGRFISDTAVSSRIKSARRALNDDGETQRLIKTLPRLGFRFMGEVQRLAYPKPIGDGAASPIVAPTARPSIAVLPLAAIGSPSAVAAALSEALPHDLIAELSRLRWLFVIARGSSFRFRGADAEPAIVRDALNVRYVISGSVEVVGSGMTLIIELVDARDDGVVWSERFTAEVGAIHEIREAIASAVIAALELQIPLYEARRARLTAPGALDAWQAFHLGLSHLYRFTRHDNARAAGYFQQALDRQPNFARALAGLSFTHFEDAFLSFADDAPRSAQLARVLAEQSLEHDPLDPFCNLVMGRAYWLDGELESSLSWLERAVALNPNYAQGKYSRAWTEAMMGDGTNGRAGADSALALSPLDPLAYGMLGVRAFSHILADEPGPAAAWADRAARSPGAHALIELIAAVSHKLNHDDERAGSWAASARRRAPELRKEDFFKAFPMRQAGARRRIAD